MDALKFSNQLWRRLQSDAGLEIRRKNGAPGRDADVEEALKVALGLTIGGEPLDTWLDKDAASAVPQVSVEKLLVAVLASQKGYAAMMRDMLDLLISANASRDDRTLGVQFQFDEVSDPIRFTLEAFRETVRRTERVLASHFELPPAKDLWALSEELGKLAESDWSPQDQFLPVAPAPRTGNTAFDRALETITELVAAFRTWCCSFGATREAAYQRAKQQYPDLNNPEHEAIRKRVGAALDFWDVMVLGIVQQIAQSDDSIDADDAASKLAPLLASLDHTDQWITRTYTELLDLLKLPTWRKRHELFSVWAGSVLLRTAQAEADSFRFLSADGVLSFAFGGSRLATYDRDGEQFDIWAELRSVLVGHSSKRKKGIQPDFRVLCPSLNGAHNAQTRLVLECKHYLTPRVSNFSQAAADYARSCPNAAVLVVNHGPIDNAPLQASISPSLQGRIGFIGDATAIGERHSARLGNAIRQAIFPPRPVFQGTVLVGPAPMTSELQSPAEASASIIDKAIRDELKIEFGRLRADDFDRVKKLVLKGNTTISEVTALKNLVALEELNLSGCTSLRDISALWKLQKLRILHLSRCSAISTLSPLENLSGLRELDLEECVGVDDLGPLWNLRQLGYLNLSKCSSISNLEDLARLDQLECLSLANCPNITDIRPLGQLSSLRFLNLNHSTATDLSSFAKLMNLTGLELEGCPNIETIEPLWRLRNLSHLGLRDCTALRFLAGPSQLSDKLDLSGCAALTDLGPIGHMKKLTSLDFIGCVRIRDLSPLSSLENLKALNFDSCIELSDLSPLERLEGLEVINLDRCSGITDFTPLTRIRNLNILYLGECHQLAELTWVAKIEGLMALSLRRCSGITDFRPLTQIKNLGILLLSECHQLTDLTFIGKIEGLRELWLTGCPNVTDLEPLASLPSLTYLDITGCVGIASIPSPLEARTNLQIDGWGRRAPC